MDAYGCIRCAERLDMQLEIVFVFVLALAVATESRRLGVPKPYTANEVREVHCCARASTTLVDRSAASPL